MQLNVSPEVGAILDSAAQVAMREHQGFVGVPHVFAALCDARDQLPKSVAEKYGTRLFTVLREVNRTAWRGIVAMPSGEVFYTPRCIDAISRAEKHAQRLRQGPARAPHLLLALLEDAFSAPSRAMDRLQQGRPELVKRLRIAISQGGEAVPAPVAAHAAKAEAAVGEATPARPEESPQPAAPPGMPSLTKNLMEAARNGEIHPAIGRDEEMLEILQILTRKTKNNVILVGEAGVGKTQVVEGLAVKLLREAGKVPDFRIHELNLASLMTGTQYRGAFEEKLLRLLERFKKNRKAVLFIDEVHLIMGAGATDGDGMDMANLLKPALARGEVRCIGATTLQEYRKFVESDPAIERRFQMVRLEELSEEASMQVLRRLRPSFERHHKVHISSRSLELAIALTQRYMPNRRLPDKAIDVLDQACARHRLTAMVSRQQGVAPGEPLQRKAVTPHVIRKVVSQLTSIPLEQMTAEERMSLNDLDRRIRRRLIGQDEAVSKAVAAVKKARVGLADPNRPDAVMLFLGPSGVGKTQLAKLLAQKLFGATDHLLTFDMSEYVEEHSVSRLLGAPPGYVGHDQEGRLTSAVLDMPFSIVLFDEIEKAHPRIYDILLPVFEEGRLRDSRGRVVSFKNCLIIMTSNVGADLLYRSDAGETQRALLEVLREQFRPEFINRIDEIVPFYPLLAEDVREILRLEINAVRKRLKDRNIGIRMYQRAYEYLAEVGYSGDFGARELRRTVDRLITTPISDKLLQGDFQDGDMIDVLMEDGVLTFRKGAPHGKKASGDKT